jgi:hypothetical protein
MMFRLLSLVVAATLVPSGFGQSRTESSTATSTSTSAAPTHTISVGAVRFSDIQLIKLVY